jgi:hypothetical protein
MYRNKFDPKMKRELQLMTVPLSELTRARDEGIQETVCLDGRGFRGIHYLILEWECLNAVLTKSN